MMMITRTIAGHRAWRTLLAAPASLALAALAVLPAAQAAGQAMAPDTIVVSGARVTAGPGIVDPATNPVLSPRSASSCAFLSAYNPAFDPISVAYMREYAPVGSQSNDMLGVTEYAPLGDVSNTRIPSRLGGFIPRAGRGGYARGYGGPSFGCTGADLRFGAGRLHILRNDKSLAQGFAAFGRKDYGQALSLFGTAWNKIGYHAAGIMLGQMHLYGLGTPKNTPQAVYWLDRVAGDRFDPTYQRMRFNPANPQMMTEQVQAAVMLARIYEGGMGVPADSGKARHWYEKAAEFGYVPALDILGRGYLSGKFSSRFVGLFGGTNQSKGLDYLKEAAQAGFAPAQFALGKLYYTGADGIPRDTKTASAWFEAAARSGHAGALFAAGRMFDLGIGVPANPDKAIVYYKEAALKGDRDAEFALGTYFYEGGLVNKDVKTARGWFDAAARQGQPDAMYNLGAMLSRGEGGPADLAMAYVWLSLANSAGHENAATALQTVGPQLSAQDRSRAEAVLKPKS